MRERNRRGRLTQFQWISLQGDPLRAFSVCNRRGKCLAIGAMHGADSPGFLVMHAKRYQRDNSLVGAVERLTGLKIRPIREGT
jgi:hypothetical protein